MATLRQLQRSRGIPEDIIRIVEAENDPISQIINRYANERKIMDEESIRNRLIPSGTDLGPGNPAYQGKTVYATNIPGTAEKWEEEGKPYQYLTNTPEETAEAKVKGYGKWGKIIGPPEAAIPEKKAKKESLFPGQPPSDEQIGDFQKFNGLWNSHVQKYYGGIDPLQINPIEARETAVTPLKEQNAQFIYDYETYGPKQMGDDSTLRYNQLQKQIKETGDLAEEKIKNAQSIAHQEKTMAHNFFDKYKKEQAQTEKLTELEKFELNDIRNEEKGLREDLKKYSMPGGETYFGEIRKETINKLNELGKRKNELMKKEIKVTTNLSSGKRDISKGLEYMKGITDRNEIIRRANILKNQHGWSKEELDRLGQKLGF